METPSSFARITRTKADDSIPISRKKEECDNKVWKQRNAKMDRSALFDITNDSPIIGLAQGRPAPQDNAKQTQTTPGSGEALLRGQVKILLQKVDGLASQESQVCWVAAPSNQTSFGVVQQEVDDGKPPSSSSDVTRALMFDFFDKPEELGEVWSSSSVGATNSSISVSKEDDDPSVWSILVNTSRVDQEEEYQDEEEEEQGGFVIDQVCEGMANIFVGNKKATADFQGKHSDDDDEAIEKEEVVNDRSKWSILHLKGIDIPQGKQLRFQEEED